MKKGFVVYPVAWSLQTRDSQIHYKTLLSSSATPDNNLILSGCGSIFNYLVTALQVTTTAQIAIATNGAANIE